jgi:sialic acid synthase SpsE
MKIGPIDTDKEVFVIAEIGNNHEGDLSRAEEMIRVAAEAGVHAVKFQTFKLAEFGNPAEKERFERLRRFELTPEQFTHLSRVAAQAGVLFISTPLDLESAKFLDQIVPAFKIGSGENTFFPLLETVARFGKPIIISSGISNLFEVKFSAAFIERVWREMGVSPGLAVLHCVSSYPTPLHEANLRAIETLRTQLPHITVGYSDHTLGIEAAVASVALGARIVEKHFTLDKNFSEFRDHKLSADPAELRQMVQRIREISEMLGGGEVQLSEIERGMVTAMRRSIVAKRTLEPGHVVCMDDLTWLRPGGGLPPGSEGLLLGRSLRKLVQQGEWLTQDALSF